MKTVIRRTVKGMVFLLLLSLWVNLLAEVFRMKIGVDLSGGYWKADSSYDMIVVGSSTTLYGINPLELWEHNGIVSYNMSSGFQSVAASYYVVKEAIESKHPESIVLDCGRIVNEEKIASSPRVHYITDQLPWWNRNRLAMIGDLVDRAEWPEFLFPLEAYHMRWTELSEVDFDIDHREKAFGAKLNAYLHTAKAFEEHPVQTENVLAETPMNYLQKIVDLCAKTDTRLYLMMMPAVGAGSELSQEEYDLRRNGAYALETYAQEQGLEFLNWIDKASQIGLDPSEDTTDGEHLTISGAEKFTDYFGDYLQERYAFADHRDDTSYAYMEKAYQAYLPYRDKYALDTANYFRTYVTYLTGENSGDYLVLLASVPRAAGLPDSPKTDEQLIRLGLETNSTNYQNGAYVALIDGGEVVYETADSSQETEQYETTVDGHSIRLGSFREDGDLLAEILIDGRAYVQSSRGLNIVVYQKSSGKVISSCRLEASKKKITFKS